MCMNRNLGKWSNVARIDTEIGDFVLRLNRRKHSWREHFTRSPTIRWGDTCGSTVAAKHYRQVLDSHFTKATQKATQHSPERGDIETQEVTENAKTLGNPRVFALKVGDTGFEPVTSTV